MIDQARASAPAKIILFGEHFVVYDKLAVVLAIEKRAYVTTKARSDGKIIIKSKGMKISGIFSRDGAYQPIKGGFEAENKLKPVYMVAKKILSSVDENVGLEITIDSLIPVAAGLGSSAAVAVASAASIGRLLDLSLSKENIFRIALEAEKLVHGNPSGVDPAISTYGGILTYCKSMGIKRLNVSVNLPLVVGDTRVKRVTGEMVLRVGKLRERYPLLVDKIMEAGGELAALGIKALKEGDLETLGELMNLNHGLLCALGVSSEEIEKLVHAARKAGALGAKLTGAGGGGCIIALSKYANLNHVAEAIRSASGEPYVTEIALDGVRIEE